MKAADIPDVEILRHIEALCVERGHWTNTTAVADCYPDVPFKVVAAKLSKLMRRGLVSGCDCGCRGDWELRQKGRDLAGITERWRSNYMDNLTH